MLYYPLTLRLLDDAIHLFALSLSHFAHPVHYLPGYAPFLSLLSPLPINSRNSDSGVTKQALLSPPHYWHGTCFHLVREKNSAFSSLVDSNRVHLPQQGQILVYSLAVHH